MSFLYLYDYVRAAKYEHRAAKKKPLDRVGMPRIGYRRMNKKNNSKEAQDKSNSYTNLKRCTQKTTPTKIREKSFEFQLLEHAKSHFTFHNTLGACDSRNRCIKRAATCNLLGFV